MLRLIGLCVILAIVCLSGKTGSAQEPFAPASTPANAGVAVLTGDSWRESGKVYRLYGVESCLRGAFYIDRAGKRQDCGAVSAAMLAAFLRDTQPQCKPVAQVAASASTAAIILVACFAHIAAERLDLGSVLIGQGFAFAALTDRGQPVYTPYFVQEMLARQARRGLWAFEGFERPTLKEARQQ